MAPDNAAAIGNEALFCAAFDGIAPSSRRTHWRRENAFGVAMITADDERRFGVTRRRCAQVGGGDASLRRYDKIYNSGNR